MAGVSPSTVSRALNRPEMVRVTTRDRVLKAASDLGYSANAIARGLATGRTMALALLVPDIANPFFSELVRAATDRAQRAGYSMLLCDSGEHPERELSLLAQLSAQVDGIVICSPRSSERGLRAVATEVPTVLVNRFLDKVPSVNCTAGAGMAQLVRHFYDLGHRSICYLQGPRESWSNRERLRSVLIASKQRSMRLHVLGPFPPTLEGGHKAAESIIGIGATAALAFDDITAMGVVGRLWDLGAHVPNDVSVAGCDDIFCAALCSPPLTTVRSQTSLAGVASVEMLVERVGNEGLTKVRHVSLAGEVVIRGSTGPVNPRASRLRVDRKLSRGGH